MIQVAPIREVLPAVPASAKACFVGVVDIPEEDLTAEKVERLLGDAQIRILTNQRCGMRLLAWYEALRKDRTR